jgi:acyl-CoA dehydrogenase
MLTNHFLSADEQADLTQFTDALNRFCDLEIEPHYRQWEQAGRVPREVFARMGEQGFLRPTAAPVPARCFRLRWRRC